MSHKIIRSLFQARLAAWAAARTPALRVAYENVAFSPEPDELYLKAYNLPAGTDSETITADHKRYTGLFQVTIVGPSARGSGAVEGVVGELAALFPLYLRLTGSGLTALVLTPVDQGPGIPNDNTYSVAASFQYRADTN
jgi:hypothetical protein